MCYLHIPFPFKSWNPLINSNDEWNHHQNLFFHFSHTQKKVLLILDREVSDKKSQLSPKIFIRQQSRKTFLSYFRFGSKPFHGCRQNFHCIHVSHVCVRKHITWCVNSTHAYFARSQANKCIFLVDIRDTLVSKEIIKACIIHVI